MSNPPTMAPGKLPNPPTIAAANALMPTKPMFWSIRLMGASSNPATAEIAAAMPHTKDVTRFTGTPL